MEAIFFVLFSCFIVLCTGYSAPPPQQCGSNEQLSCVYECPPERTCRTRGIQYRCREPTKECEEKCICKPGFFRNPLGECISNAQCDQCPDSLNQFYTCGSECDNECSTLATQNRTNCPIINIMCNKKCYCKDGFARDADRNCVPIEDCPKVPPPQQCGSNEQLSCVYDCPPEKTCATRGIEYDCTAPIRECEKKCICKPGFFRNPLGECISNEQCDQCPDSLNQFYTCGSACDNECSTLATQNRTNCLILNIMCNKKCYCKDGFARDADRNCVPIENCPKSCECTGINEEYVNCKQTCPSELCSSIVSRFDCSKAPPCKPGCACKSGYFRQNKDSPCMHVCKCSEMRGASQCAKGCY